MSRTLPTSGAATLVLREITDTLFDGDTTRVGGFTARFAGVVFPGETIHVDAWDTDEQIVVSATVASPDQEGDRRPALKA